MQADKTDLIYFAMSTVLGLVAWFTIFATIIWPKMKSQPPIQKFKTLTAIHFFRYFGTMFLMVGLVAHKQPAGFTYPAAIGDLLALVLGYIAFIGLRPARNGKLPLISLWLFNIVGAIDLLLAYVTGTLFLKDPATLGISYLIPTLYVPLLLVSHFYSFKVLIKQSHE